jgi:non-ribosomal peptide synthetase component F
MDKATREALRLPTQRKATALMNEVEIERQKAAAKGDYPLAQWLRTQIEALGQASIAADRMMVDNFDQQWQKRKESQQAAADAALKAKAPLPNPVDILNRARRK